jgi:hypothetical protein
MYHKIAAYLDEAGEDPLTACSHIASLGLKHVVLRYAWGGKNICDIPDHAHSKIRAALKEHQLQVVGVISNAGTAPAHEVFRDEGILDKAFLIAEYYRASHIRVGCGSTSKHDVTKPVAEWLKLVTGKAISAGIVPLYETTEESIYKTAPAVAKLLSENKKFKLLYDPAQLILKRKVDPFVKYWVLLRKFTAAVDVRDLKIGQGYRPVGFGDTRILETIRDIVADGNQWLFLEPSLGRRHQHTRSKSESFTLAYNALETAMDPPKPKFGGQ